MREIPKYKALAAFLKTEIENGHYNYGDRLPSENELAQTYNMSRETVRQAISRLSVDGLIERRRGSGTYVSGGFSKAAKTMNIAVITTYINEYIFPSILKGMEAELSCNGYSPILMATHNKVAQERCILQACLSKAIDGLIVEGTKTALPNPNIDLYQQLAQKGLPVVFFNGYYPELKNCIYVVADEHSGGYQATEYLMRKGHTKIAGIFKSDDIQGHRRYSGYTDCFIRYAVPLVDELVFWFTTETKDAVYSPAFLDAVNNCTAVVCYNDEIAIMLTEFLRKNGKRIPDDCAVVSFDNSIYSDMAAVKITSLDHPKESVGRLAVQKLLNIINHRRERSSVLPWRLVEKDSS
ncbi:MAG: GntR family transcriptional regulator [Acetanaerobacterium sp.]